MSRKKLIEVALPLDAINAEGAQRKRKAPAGYPTTLHKWWAQRPVAAARAVLFAQMVDDPSAHPELFVDEADQERERARLFAIMRELVKWENTNNSQVLNAARDEILKNWRRATTNTSDANGAHEPSCAVDRDAPPVFYDPFSGSGALPLEALRLGFAANSSDLNPVAVLISKAMIEIPTRFAGHEPVNCSSRNDEALLKRGWAGAEGLASDVLSYATEIVEIADEKFGHLYPKVRITQDVVTERPDLAGLMGQELPVVAWLWARTVKSPNPAFANIDVPLISSFSLSTKKGKEAFIEPKLVDGGYELKVKVGSPIDARALRLGTKASERGSDFVCMVSRSAISGDYIKSEGKAGRLGTRLMAIVAETNRGRVYLSPTADHEQIAASAKPSWRPAGEVPARLTGGTCVPYGLSEWGDLFTARQLVAHATFSDLIQSIRHRIVNDAISAGFPSDGIRLRDNGGGAEAYADAVMVYLTFALSRCIDYGSTLATWRPKDSAMRSSLPKQALPMTWDFAEASVFGESSGGFLSCAKVIAKAISTSLNSQGVGKVAQANAATICDGEAGVIVSTDPPYYSNIGYADLADFFYVWLRRTLKDVYPDLFSMIVVPKAEELVASSHRHGGPEAARQFFLKGMTEAMHRLAAIAHPAFPVTIYYAFMQTEVANDGQTTRTAWETFLEAVIRAGFSISGTWPMRTEGDNRQVGIGANALASSIVLVCRASRADAGVATLREFTHALKSELPGAVQYLQRENLAPVDLAQAAIGPGMAIFTRFSKVISAAGEEVGVRDALSLINSALDEVLEAQEGDFDSETRFAVAWFDQYGFASGEYGNADVLARAKNASIASLVEAGLAEARGGKMRLLAPDEVASELQTGNRPSIWSLTHHVLRAQAVGGEVAAAALLASTGGRNDEIRELAYRLFAAAERGKRSSEALLYNALVQSWPEIVRLSRDGSQETQPNLFGER